jgi:hypothetical protein
MWDHIVAAAAAITNEFSVWDQWLSSAVQIAAARPSDNGTSGSVTCHLRAAGNPQFGPSVRPCEFQNSRCMVCQPKANMSGTAVLSLDENIAAVENMLSICGWALPPPERTDQLIFHTFD